MGRLEEFQEILFLITTMLKKCKEAVAFSFMESLVKTKLARLGICMDGSRDSDIQVLSNAFYEDFGDQLFRALEAAYVKGLWVAGDLRACLRKALAVEMLLEETARQGAGSSLKMWLQKFFLRMVRCQSAGNEKIQENSSELDSEFYELLLDPYMNLSAGYWKNGANLNSAQIEKMDLIASKLKLLPGMTLLQIGSGFGGLCNYLAFNYQVKIVGVTDSHSQLAYARKYCSGPDVTFRLMNYDCLFFTETFDCILSSEQARIQDYGRYFNCIANFLRDDGLVLMEIPSAQDPCAQFQILSQSVCLRSSIGTLRSLNDFFVIEEIENFGDHFCKTCDAWSENLERNSSRISGFYGEHFYRKLKYNCALNSEGFRVGKYQWWQILLSKKHKEGILLSSFSDVRIIPD